MNQIQFYIDPSKNAFGAVALSYVEPFTRETLGDLLKAHHVKGKILIVARVEAIDPFYNDNQSDERSEVAVFYYNAHYLNRLIFRKHGPLNNCYTFRMSCLNPLTDTQIINISYFAVESESIGFDDLAELEGSPLLSNVPITSDLFNQSLAKVENIFVVDTYSVPIYSDSFSELPSPSEPNQKSVMYSSGSVNKTEDSSDFQPSPKSIESIVVKSETCLTKTSIRMKRNPRLLPSKTQQSLAPRTFSAHQLSLFKKMLRHSADGLSLLSLLPSHSQKYQPISPKNISGFFGSASLTMNSDLCSKVAIFGADESALILSTASISSQNQIASKTDASSASRGVTQTDSKSSMEANQTSQSSASISERDDCVEQDKFSKRPSQLKSKLDRVAEEKDRRSSLKFRDTDIDGQVGQESSGYVGSESLSLSESMNLSTDLRQLSCGFSETSNSSFVNPVEFKGLFIGTDEDFLQSPIIRLLFQANALAWEAAELLPADIYIQDDDI